MADDLDLLQRVRCGDDQAFEVLCDQQRWLLPFLGRYTLGGDLDYVYQDILVEFWLSITRGNFDPQIGNVPGYMRKIANRRVRAFHKEKYRTSEISISEVSVTEPQLQDFTYELDQNMILERVFDIVWTTFDRLDQKIFSLIYFLELGEREVATLLGKPRSTVHGRKVKMLTTLRRRLTDDGFS